MSHQGRLRFSLKHCTISLLLIILIVAGCATSTSQTTGSQSGGGGDITTGEKVTVRGYVDLERPIEGATLEFKSKGKIFGSDLKTDSTGLFEATLRLPKSFEIIATVKEYEAGKGKPGSRTIGPLHLRLECENYRPGKDWLILNSVSTIIAAYHEKHQELTLKEAARRVHDGLGIPRHVPLSALSAHKENTLFCERVFMSQAGSAYDVQIGRIADQIDEGKKLSFSRGQRSGGRLSGGRLSSGSFDMDSVPGFVGRNLAVGVFSYIGQNLFGMFLQAMGLDFGQSAELNTILGDLGTIITMIQQFEQEVTNDFAVTNYTDLLSGISNELGAVTAWNSQVANWALHRPSSVEQAKFINDVTGAESYQTDLHKFQYGDASIGKQSAMQILINLQAPNLVTTGIQLQPVISQFKAFKGYQISLLQLLSTAYTGEYDFPDAWTCYQTYTNNLAQQRSLMPLTIPDCYVLDRTNNLVWMYRCLGYYDDWEFEYEYHTADGNTNVNYQDPYNLLSPWRLPTRAELKSLCNSGNIILPYNSGNSQMSDYYTCPMPIWAGFLLCKDWFDYWTSEYEFGSGPYYVSLCPVGGSPSDGIPDPNDDHSYYARNGLLFCHDIGADDPPCVNPGFTNAQLSITPVGRSWTDANGFLHQRLTCTGSSVLAQYGLDVNETNVYWSSSDPTIATVGNALYTYSNSWNYELNQDYCGVVTWLQNGTVTISASRYNLNGGFVTQTYTMTSNQDPPPAGPVPVSVNIYPANQILTAPVAQDFYAVEFYSDGHTYQPSSADKVQWTVTDIHGNQDPSVTIKDSPDPVTGNDAGLLNAIAAPSASPLLVSAAMDGMSGSMQCMFSGVPEDATSISVTPAGATFNGHADQQYRACATLYDGSQEDVTSKAAWSCTQTSGSQSCSGAMINPAGTFWGQVFSPGDSATFTITASYGGMSGSTSANLFLPMPPTLNIYAAGAPVQGLYGMRQTYGVTEDNNGQITDISNYVTWSIEDDGSASNSYNSLIIYNGMVMAGIAPFSVGYYVTATYGANLEASMHDSLHLP